MKGLKKRAEEVGARLVLVWVHTPVSVCYERMKARGSDRDVEKLANWEAYVKKINYSAPEVLVTNGAVDSLLVFENENEETAQASYSISESLVKQTKKLP